MKCVISFCTIICILFFPAYLLAHSPQIIESDSTLFSAQENSYLQSKHEINMCIDPDWMPLESLDNSVHVGMTADYFKVMQQYLPIPITVVVVETWPQSVEFAKSRKCDIFSLAMATPERETYMDFTTSYLSIPLVMASTIDKPFVDDITSLEDVTLGVVQGYAFGELLRKRFPQMIIVDVDSVNHGLQLVVENELDGFIGTLATVGYAIQKGFPGELKVAGKFDERWELGIATRNDEPLLHSIFNKIIANLDKNTHQSILNHWISVKFETNSNYKYALQGLVLASFGIIFLLYRNYTLRKYNQNLKAQKEKLQDTERQLLLTKHAVDSCVFPIIWATYDEDLVDTVILHANQAAVSMLGYSSESIEGLPLETFCADKKNQCWLQTLTSIEDNNPLAVKTTFSRKDKSPFPVDLYISEFKYLRQKYLFLFVFDTTKQVEIEEKLHRSLKMESIGLMAGGVAHDLNNILSGIIGYPDLLLLKLPENSTMRSPLEAIRQSGLRAAEVVADLLTVARGVAAEKNIENVNNLITTHLQSPECDALRAKYPTVVFTQDLDPDLLNIECSALHIHKCLMNLVINGAESLEQGGAIHVSTKNIYIEKPLGNNRHMQRGEYVVIIVSDTGQGISPKDLPHIFEPFYTKKKMGRSGTGLGLAIVWNTVEDHRGTVVVESNNNGTTFNLYFPSTRQEIVETSNTHCLDELKGNGETILVVDDEEQQQDIAAQMLETLGYQVSTVSSGEEAIEHIKSNQIDLVILDMIMDPGINGRETYEKIIEIRPLQKTIIASGFSANEEVVKAQQLGAGKFIKKPYLISQIGHAVKSALQ